MKKIEAIIRREKYNKVIKALDDLRFKGILASEVSMRNQRNGYVALERWTGQKRVGCCRGHKGGPSIKMEIVCQNADAKKIISTILSEAHTSKLGDGRIFVYDIADVIRIRTGEKGNIAI